MNHSKRQSALKVQIQHNSQYRKKKDEHKQVEISMFFVWVGIFLKLPNKCAETEVTKNDFWIHYFDHSHDIDFETLRNKTVEDKRK